MTTSASSAFLNAASFQNCLKMGVEVCFSVVSCVSPVQTHQQTSQPTQRKQVPPPSHDHHPL